jgi:hypothetical protein
MHRVEQGARLHRVRRRRRPPQGPQVGIWKRRQNQGARRPVQFIHEPDSGGTQQPNPGELRTPFFKPRNSCTE